jgi:hypothetical protein
MRTIARVRAKTQTFDRHANHAGNGRLHALNVCAPAEKDRSRGEELAVSTFGLHSPKKRNSSANWPLNALLIPSNDPGRVIRWRPQGSFTQLWENGLHCRTGIFFSDISRRI